MTIHKFKNRERFAKPKREVEEVKRVFILQMWLVMRIFLILLFEDKANDKVMKCRPGMKGEYYVMIMDVGVKQITINVRFFFLFLLWLCFNFEEIFLCVFPNIAKLSVKWGEPQSTHSIKLFLIYL